MRLPNLTDNIKYDLIAKKQLVDLQYTKNIANINFKLKNFKNKANEYLNNKANKLSYLNALKLKQKVAELSY